MRYCLLAASLLALSVLSPLEAQDRQSDKRGNPFAAITAATVLKLEEEVELLEAQREIRKGYVHAAEIGVRLAMVAQERAAALAAKGVLGQDEVEKGKLEVEAARAQLHIRGGEMREIEVKIKYAVKRLEEARARATRPQEVPKPEERKTEERKPTDRKPEDRKPTERKPEDRKPTDRNKPADPAPRE